MARIISIIFSVVVFSFGIGFFFPRLNPQFSPILFYYGGIIISFGAFLLLSIVVNSYQKLKPFIKLFYLFVIPHGLISLAYSINQQSGFFLVVFLSELFMLASVFLYSSEMNLLESSN